MPKSGLLLAAEDAVKEAELDGFVERFKKRNPSVPADALLWLLRCARRPGFMDAPKDSIAERFFKDHLSPRGRAERFTKFFSDYPDAAPSFWVRARSFWMKKKMAKSKLSRAREAVRLFESEWHLTKQEFCLEEKLEWLRTRQPDPRRRQGAEDDLRKTYQSLPTDRPRAFEAKDIEEYLEKRYGPMKKGWSTAVEDAIRAERLPVSGFREKEK